MKMKHIILLLVTLSFPPGSSEAENLVKKARFMHLKENIKRGFISKSLVKPEPIKIDSVDVLIKSMIYVESRGNDSIVNSINAAGCLQIRPIMVKEVNRILLIKKDSLVYTLQDRFSRSKSIEMFMIWKNYHHADSPLEKIARNWNGGGNGYKLNCTKTYWKKVKEQFKINMHDMRPM